MKQKKPSIVFPTFVGVITMFLLVTRFASDMQVIGNLFGLSGAFGVLIPAYAIAAAVFRLAYNEWGTEDIIAMLVIGASMIIVANGGDIKPLFSQIGNAIVGFSIIALISVLFIGRTGGGRYG